MDNIVVTQLLYTRISHDLSGSVGAVYNGTELLNEDSSFVAQASELIQSSADILMKRLRFFRQTFGLQNKDTPDTTAGYLSTFSMPFTIPSECQNNLQRALVMSLTDVFYKGASFEVNATGICATGETFKDCAYLSDILTKGIFDPEDANIAPAVYAYYLAQSMHKTLTLSVTANSIQINITE